MLAMAFSSCISSVLCACVCICISWLQVFMASSWVIRIWLWNSDALCINVVLSSGVGSVLDSVNVQLVSLGDLFPLCIGWSSWSSLVVESWCCARFLAGG